MNMGINSKWKQLFTITALILSYPTQAAISEKVKYKTSFNNCPSRSAGKFAMRILKTFERERSLYDVKSDIKDNFLTDKHFIKNYSIKLNPMENTIDIDLSCPKPLLRVVLMDSEAEGEFQSVLVEDGNLFDPTYETLLLGEKKINSALPTLAISKNDLNDEIRKNISELIQIFGFENHNKISEVIFDKGEVLTFILSLNKKPVSVFMGTGNFEEKTRKLRRLIGYVESNQKQPTVINLVNLKKVVVKFAYKK